MGPGRRQIAVGMEAVDVAAPDQRADLFTFGLRGVPIREMPWSHVEVDRIANFKSHTRTHGGFLGRIKEANQLEIGCRVRRLIEIAADGKQRRKDISGQS